MNPALLWAGIPEPVRKALTWIGIGILIALLGKAYIEAKKHEAVQREREKQAKRAAEEAARVSETRREITQENQDAHIRADEAAASAPRFNGLDELRQHDPAGADELFPDR
jgi:hypothetical protein